MIEVVVFVLAAVAIAAIGVAIGMIVAGRIDRRLAPEDAQPRDARGGHDAPAAEPSGDGQRSERD